MSIKTKSGEFEEQYLCAADNSKKGQKGHLSQDFDIYWLDSEMVEDYIRHMYSTMINSLCRGEEQTLSLFTAGIHAIRQFIHKDILVAYSRLG